MPQITETIELRTNTLTNMVAHSHSAANLHCQGQMVFVKDTSKGVRMFEIHRKFASLGFSARIQKGVLLKLHLGQNLATGNRKDQE